jgi:hypothetical protein
MNSTDSITGRYSIQIDGRDGAQAEIYCDTLKQAMKLAKEEALWESTIFVQITDEETMEVIWNEEGSFA